MVTICHLCGDRGFSNALIDCAKCNASSIHRYCLDVPSKTFDEYVTWFCDDCELTKPTPDKSKVLTPGKSIFGSPEVQSQRQLEKKINKKVKKKLKKKMQGESEGLNKSIANTESSTSQGSPPTNHLIEAHFRDGCEGTKGEMQMELYQVDGANSVENTSHFLDHGQSSAKPPVDPVWRVSLCVRNKKSKKKLKKKVKDESVHVNKSIANAESSTSEGNPSTNHLIGAHFRDACEGTKGEMQMELYQVDGANSVENTSHFLDHGQSSAKPPVDPVWRESLRARDKKSKKNLKKKAKDESDHVNKSIANAELSKSLGSPPNNHLIETHLGDNFEATKGERQMEVYQEDKAISVENTSDFLSQSSAQPLVDPVGSLRVRDKKAMKNGKKKVEDERKRVNKSIANADLSKSQGSPLNNHLINASLEDTREGTKSEMQMELYQGNRAISVENTSHFLDHGHFSAEPLVDPVWRGSLRLTDKKFGTIGLTGHLSSLACSQAEKEAKLLPIVISAELLNRFHVWPKGFGKWGPTDESIAMFFFPAKSQENVFELLIEAMISQDLAMITEVKNADLLVFTSLALPLQYHRVFSKLYLWGVFRGKKTSTIRNAVNFRDGRDIGQKFSPYGRSLASPLSNYGFKRCLWNELSSEMKVERGNVDEE